MTILDSDILVFDVYTLFTQGHSSAYTDQFSYDGITEASTTTCASFVTPPAALTLFTATTLPFDAQQGALRDDPFSIQNVGQAVKRGAFFLSGWQRKRGSRIYVPKLWVPEGCVA